MNQSDKSDERPFLTSQSVAPPSSSLESITLTSNEKIPLSSSHQESTSTTTQLNKNLTNFPERETSSIVPQSCPSDSAVSQTPNLSTAASHFAKESAKIVVSNESSSSQFKSELLTEPDTSVAQSKNPLKRPLVAYDEDESKSDTAPESASIPVEKQGPSLSEPKQGQSSLVQEEKLFQTEFSASDAATLVEEQQPSTSTSGAPTVDSSFSVAKPKTKRVRISIKLDQYSVLRLKRLAADNPKLLRKLGLKAYRINGFNGSSNKFHVVKLPQPRPQVPQQTASSSSSNSKAGRRQSRAASSSSVTTPIASQIPGPGAFGTSSPTRFRQPFPQRVLSNFEYTKGVGPPGFSMDQTRTQTQQHFQYPQFSQQQQNAQQPLPQRAQQPQQVTQILPNQQQIPPPQQQRYPSPVPQAQPPPQSQQQQPQAAALRHMVQPEPGPSNVNDSPYLSGLLSNNSQPQQSSQPGTPQQLRYPPPGQAPGVQMAPQQQQQQQGQRMMNPPSYPQPQQQPIHQQQQQQQHMMQQHNPYSQYPPQRMPQHMMPPGGPPMQGQQPPPHMMPQGPVPQQALNPQPQESPPKGKTPRKRLSKKQKELQKEEERKQQLTQMQQMVPGHMPQHPPQEYYMRMALPPQGPGVQQQQRMAYPQGYPPQAYPSQQASTSIMPAYPGAPQHGYPGQPQQQMWGQMNAHEYQMQQMHSQMMRPPVNVNPQNPGTPTSMHGYAQSPGYPPPSGPPQKMRMQTPSYPQPSPQYPPGQQQQQQMNRQFMSPPNHPSPGYTQGQQTPNQFAYPQPQPPQQMMQGAGQNPGQPQQQSMEEFAPYDYGGGTFEGISGLEELGGEECDLDSITPMNTDQLLHNSQMQAAQQQQQQVQAQQGQIIQQQQNQPPQYEQHQFVLPHMPGQQPQQSPMGPPQGYHQSPGYQQQFQRPLSPQYMNQMMPPQQMMQHQQQQQQQQTPMKSLEGPDIFTGDGDDTKIADFISNSPSKCPVSQQKNIESSVDSVLVKCRTYDCKEYANMAWEDLIKAEEAPAPASKRKSKSTNSRPPSRQPKNSQPSSNANTPTPGPILAGNSSTGTEPSTPIKEEMMDYKDMKTERKNSTLSNLLMSGNTTPSFKSEENGLNEASCSGGIISPTTVKSERDTTATPVSTVSTPIEMEPPGQASGSKTPENNNGNDQYARFNGHSIHDPSIASMGEAVALKSRQEPQTNESSAVGLDSSDAALMPPPCKRGKTDVIEDNAAKYFEGDQLSATATS